MHNWRFFSAGGFSQASIDTGQDLANLRDLDQKLWVALAAPVSGIEFDSGTLALLDADGDGRVRAPELLAALDWVLLRLADPDQLLQGDETLPLDALAKTAEGRSIETAARRVLAEMGQSSASSIDLVAATGAADLLAARDLNGDGVVTVTSTPDSGLQALIAAIVDAGFGTADRSGCDGASAQGVADFVAAVQASLAWRAEARENPLLLPAGAATAAAASAIGSLRAKADDWYTRAALARFDARAEVALNREEGAWLALAARDLAIDAEEIRAFPLARVCANGALPLVDGLNPAWASAVESLRSQAVCPLLGDRSELSADDWRSLCALVAPFDEWMSRKPGPGFDALDDSGLQALIDPGRLADLDALIAADLDVAPAFDALTDLVSLIRLRRDLAAFCRNFVSFSDFYGQRTPAIFQCGTLYIDQRSCSLCLKVVDPARHAALAGLAGVYLAYCDCVRAGTGEKMQIVAAITDGDADNLVVGRNGLFYERQGRDWDATITRIIDNPISVRQAFWSPYRKLARFVEEQVAKRAAAADSAVNQKLEVSVTSLPANVAEAASAPASAAPVSPPRKVDVGTVAALGVALGSLGTAFGYFLRTVAEIRAWQFPLLLAGIVLAISGPSMMLAWLKLRRRNLGPLLDASGWALNARALINVPFGATLTSLAEIPAGASRIVGDRFAGGGRALPRLLLILFLVWWLLAFLTDTGLLQNLLARIGAA